MNRNITVALVDDHVMLRNGLAGILERLGFIILLECSNGKDFIDKLDRHNLPDIVLMDINMPQMDGYETALWLRNNYPLVNVLALSMYDDEDAIIRMLKNGAKGYVLKEAEPVELGQAIDSIITRGFHYSEMVTGSLLHSVNENTESYKDILSEREIEFLKLVCTEMTYKEIAAKMHLSPRTIDGYRDALFEKLDVKSRVGLVIFSIKKGIIQLSRS